MLKGNMDSLLGLLNQLMSTNNQQEQFKKIKKELYYEEEEASPDRMKDRVRIYVQGGR